MLEVIVQAAGLVLALYSVWRLLDVFDGEPATNYYYAYHSCMTVVGFTMVLR